MSARRIDAPRQRAIRYRAALACENATTPARLCECRCGGAAHGAGRGRPEDLPIDDPHAARPRSGYCRICGRHGRAVAWLDKARTFCGEHSRGELRAWGCHLGPPFPGSAPRGDVPTRAACAHGAEVRVERRLLDAVDRWLERDRRQVEIEEVIARGAGGRDA